MSVRVCRCTFNFHFVESFFISYSSCSRVNVPLHMTLTRWRNLVEGHFAKAPNRTTKQARKRFTIPTYIVRKVTVKVKLLSRVRLFETPWIASRVLCPWDFPGKNTGVGCHLLLQEGLLSQGSNPRLLSLLHWEADFLQLSHQGSPQPAPDPEQSQQFECWEHLNYLLI